MMEWFDKDREDREAAERNSFFGKGDPRKNGDQRGVGSRQLLDLYAHRCSTAITTTTAY